MKMKAALKAAWVAALRSGEFYQGERFLCRTNANTGEVRHCCLGVLTVLAIQDGVEMRVSMDDENVLLGTEDAAMGNTTYWITRYGTYNSFLAHAVQIWSGIDYRPMIIITDQEDIDRVIEFVCDPLLMSSIRDQDYVTLDQLNDSGVPFMVIADLIEKYIETD